MKIESLKQNPLNIKKPNQEKKPKENISYPALFGSLVGALAPVVAISKLRKGKLSFDIFESGSLKKDLATVLTVSTSAVAGGLAGGLTDSKTKEDKKAKVKEAIFHTLTVAIPATIATGVLGIAKKANYKGKLPNVLAPIIGIGAGMKLAQGATNAIDKHVFNKDNLNFEPKRKLKLEDYIVHIDDILALMILSKVPLANKIHADKILPLIYAWSGYEAGATKAQDEKKAQG